MFDEEELEELKILIRNVTEGKIQAKELKQKLLRSRGRIVGDISSFLTFCIDRVRIGNRNQRSGEFLTSNQSGLIINQLKQEIAKKNQLLEIVAKKISIIAPGVKKC